MSAGIGCILSLAGFRVLVIVGASGVTYSVNGTLSQNTFVPHSWALLLPGQAAARAGPAAAVSDSF